MERGTGREIEADPSVSRVPDVALSQDPEIMTWAVDA